MMGEADGTKHKGKKRSLAPSLKSTPKCHFVSGCALAAKSRQLVALTSYLSGGR